MVGGGGGGGDAMTDTGGYLLSVADTSQNVSGEQQIKCDQSQS